MNRGLALALLLLAFAVTLVGASTILVKDRLEENEAVLSSLDPKEPATDAEFSAVRRAYEDAWLLLSVSVPMGYLNEYEEALAALEASVLTGEEGSYAAARAEALAALTQIKRSALFSLGQIL